MPESLFDLDKSSEEKLRSDIGSRGVDRLMEKHADRFRPKFEKEFSRDVPLHPYKIYKRIVDDPDIDLGDEEMIVLERLKDEYTERWQQLASS